MFSRFIRRLWHRFCGVRRVLVVGPSGAGKTFITHHLRVAHHLPTFDADQLPGLCRWVDENDHRIRFNKSANRAWLKTHHFIWVRTVLINVLAAHKRIYIFGLSKNIFNVADLFDDVYYLDVPPDLLRKHLSSSDRKNPWGEIPCTARHRGSFVTEPATPGAICISHFRTSEKRATHA